MDSPPGTVRSHVAGGVAKLRARRAAGRQDINNTRRERRADAAPDRAIERAPRSTLSRRRFA